jgi:hypothetical protein
MKNPNINVAFAAGLCLVLSLSFCQNSSAESQELEDKDETTTEIFEATFTGSYIYFGPDTLQQPKCTDSLSARIIVDGQGSSNIMGEIKVHFDFCANEQGYYGISYSYFIDDNNDTLFVSGEGRVMEGKTEEHPSFVTSYWQDDFEIIGGTGRFEGATGKGKTDDYDGSEDPYSHHSWKGTITLRNNRE